VSNKHSDPPRWIVNNHTVLSPKVAVNYLKKPLLQMNQVGPSARGASKRARTESTRCSEARWQTAGLCQTSPIYRLTSCLPRAEDDGGDSKGPENVTSPSSVETPPSAKHAILLANRTPTTLQTPTQASQQVFSLSTFAVHACSTKPHPHYRLPTRSSLHSDATPDPAHPAPRQINRHE
jgi:hypothetical protein